jgi:hypothetical protein
MRTTRNSPRPHDDRPRRPARALAHVVRITAALTVVALLGACSVRLETPPQPEPSPGPVEQVRARTLDDATELASAAQAALATAPSEAVAAVLTDVADFSAQHAAQLGPEYDSGLTPAPTATPAPITAEPGDVLTDLADATRTALTDADGVEDGELARLVASIATARDQLARRLARASGVTTPDLTVDAPSAETSPSVSAAPATAAADGELETLVLMHDQAGYAYEVIAAQQSGDVRDQAVTAAEAHRATAQRWADAAGIAETDRDPRRAAYTLPDGLTKTTTARKLAVSLESAITEANATLVARTAAGGRRPFIAGMRTATAAARSWGGAPVAFPGLPERAQS